MAIYRTGELTAMAASWKKILEDAQENPNKDTSSEKVPFGEKAKKCQDQAERMKKDLQQRGDAGKEALHHLRVYAEDFRRFAASPSKGKHMAKAMRTLEHLSEALGALRDERMEIVFLPYKVAMWDCMESIYLAARNNPAYDVRVVAIPWFERDKDTKLDVMHDESGDFPADVEITPWKEFRFAEHRPDILFFHNPYENRNFTLSVHPNFYAEKLRPYVREMVYVPYYTTIEHRAQPVLGQAEGIFLADHVIVESDIERNDLMVGMREYARLNQFEERMEGAEKKFLPLGSPKYDRVRHLRPEDFDWPDSWRQCITKPDGSRKTVVFYNVSVATLLAETTNLLDKIESTLRIFAARRDEVTLLWRPHPLYRQTLTSILPDLVDRYDGIVKKYREEGWGIYDEMPEMYRAIAASDVYYGDWSSVISLFEAIGKPVMIQNPRVIE